MVGEFPGHKCQLSIGSRSNLPKLLPTASWYEKMKRGFQKSVLVSNKNPLTSRHFKSQAAVAREQRRQTNQNHFTIHPCSEFMAIWSLIALIAFTIWIFAVPFHIIYFANMFTGDAIKTIYDIFNVPVQLCFSIILYADIVVTYYSGYYDYANEEYILNRSAIRKRYLMGNCIMDIFAHFPGLVVVRYVGSITVNHIIFMKYTHTILCVTMFFYVFNLFNIPKIVRYYSVISGYFDWTARVDFILKIFAGSYWILHLITLTSSLVNMHITWKRDISTEIRYFHNIIITLQEFFGTRYKNLSNQSIIKKYLDSLFMFIGWIGRALIIILLTQILMSYSRSSAKFDVFTHEVHQYGSKMRLPNNLSKNLVYYIQYKFRNNYFNEESILRTLTGCLKTQINMDQCKVLVSQVEIFQNLPNSVIKSIVKCLKLEIFLPGESIIHHNEIGNKMFFLNSGSAAVVSQSGQELNILEDGSYFGEIALLVEDKKRTASIIAIELCETYILSKLDFYNVVEPNSELLKQMQNIALERMQQTKFKTTNLN